MGWINALGDILSGIGQNSSLVKGIRNATQDRYGKALSFRDAAHQARVIRGIIDQASGEFNESLMAFRSSNENMANIMSAVHRAAQDSGIDVTMDELARMTNEELKDLRIQLNNANPNWQFAVKQAEIVKDKVTGKTWQQVVNNQELDEWLTKGHTFNEGFGISQNVLTRNMEHTSALYMQHLKSAGFDQKLDLDAVLAHEGNSELATVMRTMEGIRNGKIVEPDGTTELRFGDANIIARRGDREVIEGMTFISDPQAVGADNKPVPKEEHFFRVLESTSQYTPQDELDQATGLYRTYQTKDPGDEDFVTVSLEDYTNKASEFADRKQANGVDAFFQIPTSWRDTTNNTVSIPTGAGHAKFTGTYDLDQIPDMQESVARFVSSTSNMADGYSFDNLGPMPKTRGRRYSDELEIAQAISERRVADMYGIRSSSSREQDNPTARMTFKDLKEKYPYAVTGGALVGAALIGAGISRYRHKDDQYQYSNAGSY